MGHFLCRKLLVDQRVKVLEVPLEAVFGEVSSRLHSNVGQMVNSANEILVRRQHQQQSKPTSGMQCIQYLHESGWMSLSAFWNRQRFWSCEGRNQQGFATTIKHGLPPRFTDAEILHQPQYNLPKSIMIQVDFGYIPVDRSC